MIPDLSKRLAFMYSNEIVKESKHKILIDRSRYFKAELFYYAIVRELKCAPDVNRLNAYLNELLACLENCKEVIVNPGDTIVLQCNTNQNRIIFWVADETHCEQTGFSIYATITSFTVPDLVSGFADNFFEANLLAESGGDKQYVQVQKSYADNNPLTEVYYWNPVTLSYIPVNKVVDWTSSIVSKLGVPYIQYTYTGPNRGMTKTKFVL